MVNTQPEFSREQPTESSKGLIDTLRGVHCYLPTPFDSNLQIDTKGMKRNVSLLAQNGLNNLSFVVTGGLGELFTLDIEEHEAVVKAAVQGAAGKHRIIAGIRGGYKFALTMARNAEKSGADAILIFSPPGGPQTIEGQERYFKDIANSVNIGVFVYPRPTQKNYWPTLIQRLVTQPNILGFKDGTGGISFGRSLGSLVRDRFIWTAKGETHALQALTAGAQAYATAFGSLMPRACITFWKYGLKGNIKGMETILNKRIQPLEKICHLLPFPDAPPGFGVAGIKTALEALGRAGGPVRPPKLQVEKKSAIAAIAVKYGEQL